MTPGYEEKAFPPAVRDGALRLVASRDGRDESLTIHADVAVYAGLFAAGQAATLPLAVGRHAYVQVARGEVRVNGRTLQAGDGAALSEEPVVQLEGVEGGAVGEVIVFDLA